jgi:hypothetical protein
MFYSKGDHPETIAGDGDHEGEHDIATHKPDDNGEDHGVDQLAVDVHCVILYTYIILVAP